jgi:hypothetical protein
MNEIMQQSTHFPLLKPFHYCYNDLESGSAQPLPAESAGADPTSAEGSLDRRSGAEETSSCPICLSTFQDGASICFSRQSTCRHCYHKECIIPWLVQHDECPYCRCRYIDLSKLLVNKAQSQASGTERMTRPEISA